MKSFSYIKGVTTLELDREACIGCGICTTVCPHNLFAMQEKKAATVNPDLCIECGACSLNCPVKAIFVDAGVGCASGMINEWLASLKISKKGGASCC
ncbi:MAG: 4Fe-4S dicluster domain-containing protein [Geobacter sp.]|nr:4Fe-4S dicluster domain-containing protein [Geobacter sp.]